MPQLPEDIIDRLIAMERRIQQLSTAVNTRPALNRISGGSVEITDGGSLAVKAPGGTAVLRVGSWSGEEYGMALRRQTGEYALALYNGNGSGAAPQVLRMFDIQGHEVLSDDISAGGLARPWLTMLPPQSLNSAHWPQTSATTWTTVAQSFNPLWQPRLRLYVYSRVSSGATGQVRVLVDGTAWGPVVAAGTTFDHTAKVTDDLNGRFGSLLKVELQVQLTSASGTVYAQPAMMYGTQS
ncbi:hypothetical protein NX801_16435 [Streptomyces sp. LP05-1]|uniref:Uncharacterized protein n=1 Tax=Streptomyces pyxinae TaxID=2970734 RepID=A0ABT2CIJ3_9ACTN|nr:hypothetical protein [Streptomyces sp. LP05-1]MCS0637221.1 hypothetical protein [Streptomyces sp. LP05-1]